MQLANNEVARTDSWALKMDVDSAFINFSYLSERWLLEFLQNYKSRFPNNWSAEREEQLDDERRHTNMLLGCLNRAGIEIVHDLNFSIQEALYRNLGMLDFAKATSLFQFEAIQLLIERRAIVLYKIFLSFAKNEEYLKVIRAILLDEEKHVRIEKTKFRDEPFFHIYMQIDRGIFSYLSARYGLANDYRRSVSGPRFWQDLFSSQLIWSL